MCFEEKIFKGVLVIAYELWLIARNRRNPAGFESHWITLESPMESFSMHRLFVEAACKYLSNLRETWIYYWQHAMCIFYDSICLNVIVVLLTDYVQLHVIVYNDKWVKCNSIC